MPPTSRWRGDPVAGARRVARVEVAGRVDALEGVRRQDRRHRDVVLLPQVARGSPRTAAKARLAIFIASSLVGATTMYREMPERRQVGLGAARATPTPPGRRRSAPARPATGPAPSSACRAARTSAPSPASASRTTAADAAAAPAGSPPARRDVVVLPVEGHAVRRQALPQDREGLVEPALRLLLARHAVEAGLDRARRPGPRRGRAARR